MDIYKVVPQIGIAKLLRLSCQFHLGEIWEKKQRKLHKQKWRVLPGKSTITYYNHGL
jgi:hypothetical protein